MPIKITDTTPLVDYFLKTLGICELITFMYDHGHLAALMCIEATIISVALSFETDEIPV